MTGMAAWQAVGDQQWRDWTNSAALDERARLNDNRQNEGELT